MRLRIILAVLCVVILSSAGAQKVNYKVGLLGFYNLENLFDTIDDPNINDAEYLPSGTKRYTSEIYWDKIGNLAKVLSQIGTDISPDGLSIIGHAEVENEAVLRDLVNHPLLKSRNYQIVHYNSPDVRGIDVAMIYNPKYFTVIGSETLFVHSLMLMELHDLPVIFFLYTVNMMVKISLLWLVTGLHVVAVKK